MRLLLVNPSVTTLSYDVRPVLPPLGIMYIASMARSRGHEVSIFDFVGKGVNIPPRVMYNKDRDQSFLRYGITNDVFLNHLAYFKPDAVGLSNIMIVTENECLRLSELIKQNYPNIFVVVGGTNATARGNTILKNKYVDFVYRGEGDGAFMDFLDIINLPKEYGTIPGICYRDNGNTKISTKIPILKDLDKNPIPAWDMIDIESYLKADFPFSFHLKHRVTTMITSRGCVRSCAFCSGKNMFGPWRTRNPENVINEALFIKEKYGIEEIQFLDSNISLDRRHFEGLLKLWKERVRLCWAPVGGLDVSSIDDGTIYKMGESGCHSFPLGIEAGGIKTQNYINKIVPCEKVTQICRAARKQGMWSHGLFIIGFPQETKEDIFAILNYAKEADLDSISMFALSPLPGSLLYSKYIDDDNFDADLSRIGGKEFPLSDMPCNEIIKCRTEVMRSFFIWKLFRELRFDSIIVRIKSPKFLNMFCFLIKSLKRFLILRKRDKIKK